MSLPAFGQERAARDPIQVPTTDPSRSMFNNTRDGDSGEEDIDPNGFEIMLSRSLTSGGSMLEPESYEQSMLRGPRRYSRSRNKPRRRGSGASFGSKAGSKTRARDGPSTERTPLLGTNGEVDEAGSGAETDQDDSPYLGGVSVARFWVIFMEIQLTYFIACFDGTTMASSHPAITSYFGASNQASWLSTAFLLASTTFQPLLGRLSDTLGRKPLYTTTMVIFLLATVWCGLAQSMTSLIIARAVCGLGAGGMMTLGSILVSDLVPIEIRGTYQAIINVTFGVGSMLGAAMGGLMVDNLGWRWEFGIQVPPLFLCMIISILAIPPEIGLNGKAKQSFREAMRAFDFAGSASMSVSVTFLILGLNLGGNVLSWSHPFIIASLVIFAVFFPLFLYIEATVEKPIMPLHLVFKSPHMNLIFSNHIAAFLVNGIVFNMPLFFQGVLLTSATTSGLRLIVPSAISSFTGTMTGFAISWTRGLKWPLMLGSTFFFIGLVTLSSMQRGWSTSMYLLSMVPSSIGQGAQFPGTFMALLAASDQSMQAVVTSTLILWRSLGMVLGVAVSSLLVQNALTGYLDVFVDGPEKEDVISRVRQSVEAIHDIGQPYQEQVIHSYEAALRLTFMCMACLAAVSVLLIIPVKLPRLGSRK